MVRLVTQADRDANPDFDKRGISVNMYHDFTNENPPKNNYSTGDYDITEYTPIDYGNFLPKPKVVNPAKKWHKHLDKIYVINLAKRKDRMLNAVTQLNKYSIPFERVEAIEHPNGAEGLRLTMEKLFKACIKAKYENVLVVEDDIDLIEPEINSIMDKVMSDLPENFDIIYLGCQLCNCPKGFYNYNLLKGVDSAFSTHAAIYSLKAMKDIIKGKMEAPIDNYYQRHIQQKGNCYAVYPMVASQIVSHSDIYSDAELMDWKPYLENKFYEMTKHLPRTNG